MDNSEFWSLIEAAKQEATGSCMQQVTLLTNKLSRLPPGEIIEFQRLLVGFMDWSYTNDLWAAAYIVNGGCSNDCFDYFRAWLIGQGETVFDNAMRDPETLIDANIDPEDPDVECQHMMYVAEWAYQERTGQEMPRSLYMPLWIGVKPKGDRDWDEESCYDKYPRLAAKFGASDEVDDLALPSRRDTEVMRMAPDSQTTSGYLPVEGGELYYEVTGTGHPLVLIHAGVADLRQWEPQIPAFAARYRVIRYDTRGYGQTRTQEVSFSNRQDLHDLLTHLGVEKTYLIGNSRGGQIAIDFTLEHPDMVDALIPVAAGLSGYPFDPSTAPQHETDAFTLMEELWEKRDFDALTDLEVRVWADGPGQPEGRAAPEVREKLRQMIGENYARDEPEPTAQPLQPPAAERLAEIRIPTLVILGDLDTSGTLVMGDAMEAGIAGARKVIFPGVAHMVSMERPEEFTRLVLDFLGSVEEGTGSAKAGAIS